MFVMTAKVNKTKIAAIITAIIALVVIIIIAVSAGTKKNAQQPPNADSNDARIRFLAEYGWDVNAEPVQAQPVTMPQAEDSEVFLKYNELQKSQGYDLSQYAGKKLQRFVYEILNYPQAEAPVYATMFVLDGTVVGGDITNTAPDGKMHGFALPSELCDEETFRQAESEVPTEAATDTCETTEAAE